MSGIVDVLHFAVDGLTQQQQAIANNLANAETPGFTATDVNFQSSLQAAMDSSGGGSATVTVDARPAPPRRPTATTSTPAASWSTPSRPPCSTRRRWSCSTPSSGWCRARPGAASSEPLRRHQHLGRGIDAAQVWINTTAGNIANANDTVPTSQAVFASQTPVFGRGVPGQVGDGVTVSTVQLGSTAGTIEYQPTNPLADTQGDVRVANVDLGSQMVGLIQAQTDYQANTSALSHAKQAYQSALTIGS